MIRARQISFTVREKKIVHPLDIQFSDREFCVILGANGAGKSTLLHLLAGSIPPSSGQILFQQKELHNWHPLDLAQKRGFLLQANSLSSSFTVRQVLRLGRYPYTHEDPKLTEIYIEQILRQLGMKSLENAVFNTLSGGEQQRVQFARVLLQVQQATTEKSVLFLDEPLNNLDIHFQTEILHEARRFVLEGKGTVIAVLHDLNLSFQFADRAILLHQGKIIADGNVADVFIPETLSLAFKTKINHYQTAEGFQYFFSEKGQVKHDTSAVNNPKSIKILI